MNKKSLPMTVAGIYAGTFFIAAAVIWFFAPIGLVTGGLAGLSIVIEELGRRFFDISIPLWFSTLVMNIPLFAVSIYQRGLNYGRNSMIAVACLTFNLWLLRLMQSPFQVSDDRMIACIFGGVALGIGVGMVLRNSATTGGTDMLAMIIRYKNPSFPINKLMLMTDVSIVVIGMFVFGASNGLYAILSIYITSKVIETMIEGMKFAKAAFIISPKYEEISEEIMDRIRKGNTLIHAHGMYTKQNKNILYVVILPKQVQKLKEIVSSIDPHAFVTIADVKEVMGEGFENDGGL
ncbi:YitT family protein [Filifactor villosus]|uniref:YitT family protein n=1 Tax=Filifactor villosus TaxID=29374 RepID=A0ABV9QHX5_9FIRM